MKTLVFCNLLAGLLGVSLLISTSSADHVEVANVGETNSVAELEHTKPTVPATGGKPIAKHPHDILIDSLNEHASKASVSLSMAVDKLKEALEKFAQLFPKLKPTLEGGNDI